ncbi:hemolysin activation/secretion protein [Caulobacter sp. AP07]|uniref:ShlB/FhaC/HecB family hemolysin secretion/activation protein n=1 Tax=Caulobacter sp. AP07 TaxID=1144304 RepID=UPI000271E43C|nr:ShlB/FhaC/HecB family hemolysin secretion/activation protein [Caulobacter sp. AP07]EJL23867.1 hemolysin activation/secretion protein [Caulobacter sp. AP07]
MALAAPALAQVALPSREELDPARASPIPAAPRGDLFDNVEKTPCSFAGSDLKLTLRNVEVRGAVAGALALTPEELSPAYAREIGREIPIAAICDIRDRVSALYLRRGVLASVTIPEQRINDGRLVLEVVEARIASVTYHGDVGPAQKQVARYLDQLKGMAPFDLNVAQRYLLLASDIPGVRVQATLKPAPGGQGAVDLDIAVSRDAFDGSVQAQNYGSRTIGRELGLARIDFNSFTSLGERTSLVGYWTLGSDEQRVIQATEHVKLGGGGLALDLSGSWAWTRPGDAVASLKLEGESFAGSARLSYPIVRHRRHNLNLGVGLDWVDQQVDFGGGVATLTEDHVRVFFARLDGHWAPRALADRSAALTGSFEVRQGTTGLGASRYGELTASRFQGVPDALVWRAEAQAGGQLIGPIYATATLSGQFTQDPLLSYEEFSVGNLSIGRGYDPSAASGDRAIAASLELTTTPLRLFHDRAVWRPYAFYDAAKLTNIGPGANKLDLASAGVGVRAQITPRVSLDLAWAKPFDDPLAHGDTPSSRVLVSLSAALF